MNELFTAFSESKTDDLIVSWSNYADWWDEISSYDKLNEVNALTPVHVAAMIAYGGNCGNIPGAQIRAFNEAVEASKASLLAQFGTNTINQKLYSACKHAPFA